MTATNPISELDLAKMWNVSPDTIQRIRLRGEITFTRVGGRIRYSTKHISDYLEANETRNGKQRVKHRP